VTTQQPAAATDQLRRSAEVRHADDLRPGDRVQVSELRGLEWHTVIEANNFWVRTEEVPTGFRRAFVVDVQRQGECESCRAQDGTPHNKNCG